jgi:exodeoxyribonuclease-3
MKIATFNAASVRARLPVLVEWLATEEPDVLVIQETKVEDDKFPKADFELRSMGRSLGTGSLS